MQQTLTTKQTEFPAESLAKIFNTAVLSTKCSANQHAPNDLLSLMQSPEFSALLDAVRSLCASQGCDEQTAAERLIATFRSIDSLWNEALLHAGLDRLTAAAPAQH
jgi:ribonuclease D